MENLLLAALLIPLASAVLLMSFSKVIADLLAGIVGALSVVISFCLMGYLFFQGASVTASYFHWIDLPGFKAPFALHLDHLSQWMSLIITGVGALIHIYSIGYMEGDRSVPRFFACMNFFIFSMLLLVLADNLLLLFVGWEGVGAASYLLIGFWHEKPSAERAALKAFMINRIGDFGLLMGILLLMVHFGTVEIAQLNHITESDGLLTVATLLLFMGATGKSAQLPLHSWLPDAMEGPTPVSALIHAATMVTAGVYLVVRMHPLFLLAPFSLYLVGVIGVVGALYAAMTAVGQIDLKKVLAYSTMSQLGLMFLACGAGAFYAALFHLTTHAFIKALLFLTAGNVLHALDGENDMRKMGGLKKQMPQSNVLFLIGLLALSGIPPLAAFFSKDLILAVEFSEGYYILYLIGLAASVLTAFYLTRAYCLTFLGEGKGVKAHEAPKKMLYPLYALAFLSVVGGFLLPYLEGYLKDLGLLAEEIHFSATFLSSLETWVAFFLAVGAIWLSYRWYHRGEKQEVKLLAEGLYLDQAGRAVISKPAREVASFVADTSEPELVDGSLQGIVKAVDFVSSHFRQLQNGQIRSYAAWFTAGAALLLIYLRLIHD